MNAWCMLILVCPVGERLNSKQLMLAAFWANLHEFMWYLEIIQSIGNHLISIFFFFVNSIEFDSQLGAQTYIASNTQQSRAKAKPFLEKALKMNANYQPAILFMVTLLVEEGNTARAILLLRKLASVRPSPEIYAKIGDIYAERKQRKEAIECYTEAITYVFIDKFEEVLGIFC